MMPNFGRKHVPDKRDTQFPMHRAVPRRTKRSSRHWDDKHWWGNQGKTPQCVGYAWAHWLEDAPVVHKRVNPPLLLPKLIYRGAQRVDKWGGTNYKGTNIRAGAKVLQMLGLIDEYHWARTLDDVIAAVLDVGPVVVGTDWYVGMTKPKNGRVRLTGKKQGEHAYLLNGVNLRTKRFRIKNSLGRGWGMNGRAYISFDDFERLLSKRNGEACLATELPV